MKRRIQKLRNLRLDGKYVYLEEIQPKYFPYVIDWRNNPENNRFLNQPFKLTMGLQKKWYNDRYINDFSQGFLVMIDKNKDTPFGTIGWTDYDSHKESCIVGRLLIGNHAYKGSKEWIESTILLNDFLYYKKGVKKIYAHVCIDNIASIKWHYKWGYQINSKSVQYPEELYVNGMIQNEFVRSINQYSIIREKMASKIIKGNKIIVVTGGAGFIGSNFIFHMLEKYPDYRIICLDKLTYAGNLSTLEDVMDNPNFRFVKADICDREAVHKLFEEEHPDIVVNFAAESHVDRSIEDPGIFLETNIKGTAVLMDACRKYGIKRYHQVSTDEVYGDLPLDRPDLFFTEETPIHTSSPYSSSKAGADLLVMAYHRTYGLPVTISRCSNNYGPYQFPEKLIPLMITKALAEKPLPVYGQGVNVRDWLYVEDHCKAIDLIIHKGRVGEVYNVGGHNEMRNIDIVKLICKELGKPESLITYVIDRKGHDMRYAIDPTRIHNELGWLPETKFADGIKKTIKWYLENKKWWMEIVNGKYQDRISNLV